MKIDMRTSMTDIDHVEYEAWLNECYAEADEPRSLDDALKHLLTICNHLLIDKGMTNDSLRNAMSVYTVDNFAQAVEEVEAWLENETDDPRQMGWVDDRGRP